MNSKKARNLLLGLLSLGLLIFIIISFVGISMLGKKSQAMVDLKIKSATIDAQLINLAQAKKDVEKYRSFNDIAASVIPKDKNQVQAIADIFKIAQESGISLQSVAFPVSTLGAKAAPSPAASTSATQQTTATPATPTQSAISQAKPFSAVPGLYSLELTITPQSDESLPKEKQVTFPKFINFLSAIENNRRTAQITNVTIQPLNVGSGNSELINFTLTLNIFIKP
jgi:hypothetical protein